ncbi:MAG: zf-TFIIB domain-containing protein [Myxococcota bacterium]
MADEDDYFRKLDQEAKAKLKAKLDEQAQEAARAEQKALHHLKCGKCGSDMATQVFRGLEVEVCGGCGAVLLDPGELQTLAGADQTATFSSFFTMFGGRAKS